ncbi:MAG: hypothetical protein KC657_12960 [Myxococcales bacterium]|nr:hypothetical protein [Myxococcales bacterium]
MKPNGRRKLLSASLGVASVTYVLATASCHKEAPATGNLVAPPPTETEPPLVGNLPAPPEVEDAGQPDDASAATTSDAGVAVLAVDPRDAGHAKDAGHGAKTPVPLPKPPPITGNLPAPPSRTTKAQPITPKRTK